MRMSGEFPSKYLKAADLQDKQVTVRIDRVVRETIGEDQRPVVYFAGKEKGLVLNKTNANNIAYAYGDESDDWAGCEIILFPTMVDFQGRSTPAIRVKVPPRKPVPAPNVTSGRPAQPQYDERNP